MPGQVLRPGASAAVTFPSQPDEATRAPVEAVDALSALRDRALEDYWFDEAAEYWPLVQVDQNEGRQD
jgi:hypothetical protein